MRICSCFSASAMGLLAVLTVGSPAWGKPKAAPTADTPDTPDATPPAVTQPTREQLVGFQKVRDDDDVREIKRCTFKGTATHKCRDPLTYYKTNEGMRALFVPYIRDLRGGYVGIASDQNYDFIAVAKSEWVWLFDYDPSVVHIHQTIRAVALHAETPERFIQAYREENFPQTLTWLRESLGEKSEEVERAVETATVFRERLLEHYEYSAKPKAVFTRFGWLSNPEHYKYIRSLFRTNRVVIRKGNLLTDVVLPDITTSAESIDVPIRILYTSNAIDMWPLTPQLRKNLARLPFDGKSVFLHTLGTRKLDNIDNELDYEGIKWLFIVHKGKYVQWQMKRDGSEFLREMCTEREATRFRRLFTVGPVGSPKYVGRRLGRGRHSERNKAEQ